MASVLIVGATRGLGAALVEYYSSRSLPGTPWTIYATSRSSTPPKDDWANKQNVHWLLNIDLEQGPESAKSLAGQIQSLSRHSDDDGNPTTIKLNTVIISAGYFATEQYGQSNWTAQVRMYTLSSIAPVFIIEQLDKHDLFHSNSTTATTKAGSETTKIMLVSSEAGSLTLRHAQEGGGNYGHHGSKAALNMVGRQLAFDLEPRGIPVGIVHPSFMRTEMTRGVGFDKFWDEGGAVEPGVAAGYVAEWVERVFGMEQTGQYWAPRGTRDIGNWGVVVGEDKGTEDGVAVRIPW